VGENIEEVQVSKQADVVRNVTVMMGEQRVSQRA
jgi:hypothetical protein